MYEKFGKRLNPVYTNSDAFRNMYLVTVFFFFIYLELNMTARCKTTFLVSVIWQWLVENGTPGFIKISVDYYKVVLEKSATPSTGVTHTILRRMLHAFHRIKLESQIKFVLRFIDEEVL